MKQQTITDLAANGVPNASLGGFVKALFLNPSFASVYHYRIYSKLFARGKIQRLLARIIWRHNTKSCGCHISPEAQIGQSLSMVHPHGVVIGGGAKIDDNVKIYQNVTLGSKAGGGDLPHLKNGATVFAGASILGSITIGENAVIGANSVVLNDVPDNAVAVGAPARIIVKK